MRSHPQQESCSLSAAPAGQAARSELDVNHNVAAMREALRSFGSHSAMGLPIAESHFASAAVDSFLDSMDAADKVRRRAKPSPSALSLLTSAHRSSSHLALSVLTGYSTRARRHRQGASARRAVCQRRSQPPPLPSPAAQERGDALHACPRAHA